MLQVVLSQGIVARGNTCPLALFYGLLVCLHLGQVACLLVFAFGSGRRVGLGGLASVFGHAKNRQSKEKKKRLQILF